MEGGVSTTFFGLGVAFATALGVALIGFGVVLRGFGVVLRGLGVDTGTGLIGVICNDVTTSLFHANLLSKYKRKKYKKK